MPKQRKQKVVRKRKPKTARIYYGISQSSGERLYWTIPFSLAKHDVVIDGTLADAMMGIPGDTIGCHLSKCATRNSAAFPHAFKLAAFNKTTCFIMDRIAKGKPSHMVKYRHSYGKLVDLNDKDIAKTFVREHPELVERSFVLRKMRTRKKVPGAHGDADRKRAGNPHPVVPRGAMKRALDAGLITADLDLL
jgi:hypothetical protein